VFYSNDIDYLSAGTPVIVKDVNSPFYGAVFDIIRITKAGLYQIAAPVESGSSVILPKRSIERCDYEIS